VELCQSYIDAELERAKQTVDPNRYQAYLEAASLMRELIQSPRFTEFLTVPAYARVIMAETADRSARAGVD
jgi:malate synthase